MTRPARIVAVPVDLALVFDGVRGWHYATAPPAWWMDEQGRLLELDEVPRHLVLVPAPAPAPEARRTACRPGRGPCRRRHEHAGGRVAA